LEKNNIVGNNIYCESFLITKGIVKIINMAKPKKKGGPKQKLSPEARKAKAKRDLKIAKSPRRMKMKRDNYAKRKEAEKKFGKLWLLGKDYDHEDGKFESVKRNRGNDGKGTKKEGSK